MRDLREELRDAARRHEPDRARILARVERGTGAFRSPEPTRRGSAGPRLPRVLAAGAATCALLVGVFALTGPLGDTGPREPAPAGPMSTPTLTTPAPTESVPARVEEGPLWSDGSVDPGSSTYWSQSNVTVDTAEPLSALTVELRIAPAADVSATGHWRTLPADDFDVTVREAGDALVYRWTLREGRTAAAGRHVFAGQYDHEAGRRDAGPDTYTVRAETSGGRQLAVHGGFAPKA